MTDDPGEPVLDASEGAALIDALEAPRTGAVPASLFAALIADKNLQPACRGMTALTLSEAVAKALHPLEFRAVLIARAPTAEGLLALLT